MKKFWSVALVLFAMVLSGCVHDEIGDGRSLVAVGDLLPEFSVIMSDGNVVDTHSLAGNTSVIVFFNTSCPDCREELPVIQQLHNLRPDIKIICIAREESTATIEPYWIANGLSMPYSPQKGRAIFNLFATEGIPRIYVADATLRATAVFDDVVMPTLNQLLESL